MKQLTYILLLLLIPVLSTAQTDNIIVKFEDFSLIIENIKAWDENNELEKIQNDTVLISLDIGEIITNNLIKIFDSKYDKIKIYQRFENSITINNEGPHCDLINWKHYTSKWIELKQIRNGIFETILLDSKQAEKFIEIEIVDFKNAVKKSCGNDWVQLIKDIKSVRDYPCEISTSKIELIVKLIDNSTQETMEKYLIFDIPMGC